MPSMSSGWANGPPREFDATVGHVTIVRGEWHSPRPRTASGTELIESLSTSPVMQKVACTRVCYSNGLKWTTASSLKDHVLPQTTMA